MNIAFIGAGNMARALIGGLLKQGRPVDTITAVDVDGEARRRLEADFGVAAYEDAAAAVAHAECIVFAVKPQQLRDTAERIAGSIGTRLVITIAAGIRSGDLCRWLGGYRRIVRAMPNTPALVGHGITGLYALPDVPPADRARAEELLAAAGATLWVHDETQLDGVTAVSGSGPAYVFYFLEALQQAALEQGFRPDAARMLALATFEGALRLAAESPDSPEVLRARVTSKGGTTERAIAHLEAHEVKRHIVEAVAAAAVRSRELGDELGAAS